MAEALAHPTTMPMPRGVSKASIPRAVDPWMLGSAMMLVAVGCVMVYSASAVRSMGNSGASSAFLVRHLVSVGIGLLLLSGVLRIGIERWSRHAYTLLALTVIMLIAVYIPGLGRRVNGALRWLAVGPVAFQPAELSKLAIVVYLAHSLAKKREKVRTFSVGFLPHAIVAGGVVLLLLLQPDFGTSVIIFVLLGVMMFVAGTKVGYLLASLLAASPVAFLYIHSKPHAMARLLAFRNPEVYKADIGYQVWESLVSFGSGGITGLGLGAGRQKLYFLPEAHTDFIFAVIGEELGFIGAGLVIVLFAILVGRGVKLALDSSYRFEMFLAFGISTWFGVQALTNMAVVLALAPTKGLTLPFVSYGGSSQVISAIALGILLRISAEQRCVSKAKRP